MITLACDDRAADFFRGPVASYFYVRTGERLRVIRGAQAYSDADFIVVPEQSIRANGEVTKAVRSLTRYRTLLSSCGGFVGPFVSVGRSAVGLRLEVGTSNLPEVPESLDFLTQREKLVLAAVTDRGLGRRGEQRFYHLTLLTQCIAHHLPFVPSLHVQNSLTVGEKTRVLPKSNGVSARTVSYDAKENRAVFDLTVINTTEDFIEREHPRDSRSATRNRRPGARDRLPRHSGDDRRHAGGGVRVRGRGRPTAGSLIYWNSCCLRARIKMIAMLVTKPPTAQPSSSR
jgi:hypothetical protein